MSEKHLSGGTIGALVLAQAARYGDKLHLRLLADDETETLVSYARLAEEARRYAEGLRRAGVRPGDRLLLMLPTGLSFVGLLYGALLAGAVPVPLYPPFQLKGLAPYLARLGRIAAQVQARFLVTDAQLHGLIVAGLGPLCPPVRTPEALYGPVGPEQDDAEADAPALIQFSSGSTGPQKGVVLTHRALDANCRAIADRLGLHAGMRGCAWLPLYHDMGLVGCLLSPLRAGVEGTLFSPKAFLLDPVRWLRTIDRYRSQVVLGPNFAYRLLLRRAETAGLEGLDLSCVEIALNGAEPIDEGTVEAFEERFAAYGWRPGAMIGVYGLAEVGLAATMPEPGTGTHFDRLDADRLSAEGLAAPGADRAVASVGTPLAGYRVEIRDASGAVLPERREGEVAVCGPSLMSGYHGNPEGTAQAVQGGWLLTGDLGYLADGRLYITGRRKDLIIRGGRNYHPQDLELAAEAVSGVRGGAAVAFGLPAADLGTERVVVAIETKQGASEHARLAREVAVAVLSATGLRPDEVLVLPVGTVPKTTSGKRQRQAARALHQQGRLGRADTPLDALKQAASHHLPGPLRAWLSEDAS